MDFLKVEGAGNDYVLVDARRGPVPDPVGLARQVSDRHTGVGSDGLLLLESCDPPAVARMRIFNADGSEGRMCGNGLRCVLRWLLLSGEVAPGEVVVDTVSGPRRGRVAADRVEVDMGRPDPRPDSLPTTLPVGAEGLVEHPLPAELGADPHVAFGVSVGNPHLVARVSDPGAIDLVRHGEALASSPHMPEGANVHFVACEGRSVLRARVFERGSGPTRACGSGAVAIAAVATTLGWSAPGPLEIAMPGGRLQVDVDDAGHAWLGGPARIVFRGTWVEP